MTEVGPDSICFDVLSVVDPHKLLVDITAIRLRNCSRKGQVIYPFRALVSYLAKQLASSSTLTLRVVDADFVIFSAHWFLDKGFCQQTTVNTQSITVVK